MTATAPEQWLALNYEIERVAMPGEKPLQLARRMEDGAFALVRHGENEWCLFGPVVTLDLAMDTAAHVAAGHADTLTWPKMPLVMATALLAMNYIARTPHDGAIIREPAAT